MLQGLRKQVPRPADHEEFEQLTRALFAEVWSLPSLRRHGGWGQRDHGVDLLAYEDTRLGIQCKLHEVPLKDRELIAEMEEEVERAKTFMPALDRFVFATTVRKRGEVQRRASELSEENRRAGLFNVETLFWDDYEEYFQQAPEVLQWYLGRHFPRTYGLSEVETEGLDPEVAEEVVGREYLVQELQRIFDRSEGGTVLLQGPPGIGKSSFMLKLRIRLAERLSAAPTLFAYSRAQQRTSLRLCLQSLYFSIASKYARFPSAPSEEPEALAEELVRLLQTVRTGDSAPGGEPEVLLVDGLDEASDPARALRLLARNTPAGVFFVVASRYGDHLEGYRALPGALEPVMMEPLSDMNLADAQTFLKRELPDWSSEQAFRIAYQLKGNFLVLARFAELARTRELDGEEALTVAEQLREGDELLDDAYALFWSFLRERTRDSHPHDLEPAFELLGLLGVAAEPLTKTQASRFLGGWTVARLERVYGHVRSYVERDSRGRWYLFHDTFESYVHRRLAPDLSRLHRRIAHAYTDSDMRAISEDSIDDYGWKHALHHVARGVDGATALSLLTPEFLTAKRRHFGSIVALLEDLRMAIDLSQEAEDICSALLFGSLSHVSKRGVQASRELPEILAIAQDGEIEAVWNEARLRAPDEQMLVLLELVERLWRSDRELALAFLARMDGLSFQSSSEVLEAIAVRLVSVEPEFALRLTQRIPEPGETIGEEPPTAGRALFNVIKRMAEHDADSVSGVVSKIEEPSVRALAWAAAGDALLPWDPSKAWSFFDEACTANLPGVDNKALLHHMCRHLLRQLPDLEPRVAKAVLEGALKRIPGLEHHWITGFYLFEQLQAQPGIWLDYSHDSTEPAMAVIKYRLWELSHGPRPDPEELTAGLLREYIRAEKLAERAETRVRGVVADLEDVPFESAEGVLMFVARIGRRLRGERPSRAGVQAAEGAHIGPVDKTKLSFDPYLALLEVALRQPTPLRSQILESIWKIAGSHHTYVQSPARIAFARVVARAASDSGEPWRFVRDLVSEQTEEMRRKIAAGVLWNISTSELEALSAEPGLLELWPVAAVEEDPLFLPETQARLLTVVAERLLEIDRERAAEILRAATSACGDVEPEEQRGEVVWPILHTAVRFSPGFVWELFSQCRGSIYSPSITLRSALRQASWFTDETRREALRSALEVNLQLPQMGPPHGPPKGFMRRYGRSGGLLLSEEAHVRRRSVAKSQQWRAVPQFLEDGLNYLEDNDEDRELHRLREDIVPWLARADWHTFRSLRQDPNVQELLEFSANPITIAQLLAAPGANRREILEELKMMKPQREWHMSRDRDLVEDLRSTLLASATALDHAFLIDVLEARPDLQASSWPLACSWRLKHFEPKAPMTRYELERLLEVSRPSRSWARDLAALLIWEAEQFELPDELVDSLCIEALKLEDSFSLRRTGETLQRGFPMQGRELLRTACRRAVEDGDVEQALYALDALPGREHELEEEVRAGLVEPELEAALAAGDHPRIVQLLWKFSSVGSNLKEEALNALAQSVDSQSSDRAVEVYLQLLVDLDPPGVIQALEDLRPDFDGLSDVMRALAQRLPVVDARNEAFQEEFERVVHLTISASARTAFAVAWIERGRELGIENWESLCASVPDLTQRTRLRLDLAERASQAEREEVLRTIEEDILGSSEPERYGVRRSWDKLIRYFLDRGLEDRAVGLFREGISLFRRYEIADLFLFALEDAAELALELPGEHVHEALEGLWELAERFPYAADPRSVFATRERALALLAGALWSTDSDAALNRLRRISTRQDDVEANASSFASGIGSALLRFFDEQDKSAVEQFLDAVLGVLEPELRSSVSRELAQHILSLRNSREHPLQSLGIDEDRLVPRDAVALERLSSDCPLPLQARIQFALGVTVWPDDEARGRKLLADAVRDPEVPATGYRFREHEFWLAHGGLYGPAGGIRALRALLSHESSVQDNVATLLAWMIREADEPYELLADLWAALDSYESYRVAMEPQA